MRMLCMCAALLMCAVFKLNAQTEITVHDEFSGEDYLVELPESMEHDLDLLLDEWIAKKYLSQEDDCNYPLPVPVYEKEVYVDRLRRLPHTMDMSHNDVVQQFIDQYSGRLRRSISYMLGAMNFYAPLFEEVLDLHGLPLELKYLPIIESALNPSATSRVGASGLWQFMLATGQMYDLEVTSMVDERRDPIKSTYAAARYLKDLYGIYADWNLVIAAYNCGPGNVNKAIARSGGAKDYWAIYPYLPKETRGYVPAFIATNYIMNYYCNHNICPMSATLPMSTDTVHVHSDLHFQQIADLCDISIDEVKVLNPQYRTQVIPGGRKTSVLRLPQTTITAFIHAQDTIYQHRADELLKRRSAPDVKAAAPTAAKNGKSASSSQTVVVKKNDTLGKIAQRHKTTVKKIQALNGLKNTNVRVGQTLRVR